jgi:hypothetical protein
MACLATTGMLLTLSLLFANGIPTGATMGAATIGHTIIA